MSERCEEVRQWILEAQTEPPLPKRHRQMQRHVQDCEACGRYEERLRADEALLTGYANSMRWVVAELETSVLEKLGDVASGRRIRGGRFRTLVGARQVSRFAAIGAAAAMIVLVIGLWPRDRATGTVYGMSDVPRVLRQAETIRIRRYFAIPENRRAPGDEQAGEWHVEDWIDVTGGRSLTHSLGVTVWRTAEADGPKLVRLEHVLDGRYRMQINHSLKHVQFYRLSEFQALLSARRAVDKFLDRASLTPEMLEGFVRVGAEQVDGVDCEIWRRQQPIVGQNMVIRTHYWLSPASGQLKRVREWVRDDPAGEWRLQFEEELRLDAVPPDGVFATNAPPGYRLSTSKENAPVSRLIARQIDFDDVKGTIAIIIVLPDGSAIVGWALEGPDWTERVANLRPGQLLPKAPVAMECRATSATGSPRAPHVGRYLASTTKDGQVYEWDIHVPSMPAKGPIALRHWRLAIRSYAEDVEVGASPEQEFSLLSAAVAIEADEFDLFVRGAMAELSDNRMAPDHVSYEFVRQLAAVQPRFAPRALVVTSVPAIAQHTTAEESQALPAPVEAGPEEPNEQVPIDDTRDTTGAGVVKNDLGQPVAEATVLLYHNRNHWGLGNRVVARVRTDANGRFRFESPVTFELTAQRASLQDSYALLATHPDYALGWQQIRQGQEKTYEMTLTQPVSRTITVTDHNDLPLAGVRVWLSDVGDRKSSNPLFRDDLSLPTDTGLVGATTDSNGQAVVENLPATSCCFSATLSGYADGWAFSSQNRIRLSPGGTVSGWVLTNAGDPVSEAVVRLYTQWYMHQYFLAETDSEGHFELRDLPARGWDMSPFGRSDGASGHYQLTVEHEDYAGLPRELHLSPGETIDDLVIEMATETTLVRCLVLEEGTDMPVPGARIDGTNQIGSIEGESDPNGVFTVRVLPGPVALSFQSPPDGVYILDQSSTEGRSIRFDAQGGEMEVVVRSPVIAGPLVTASGTVHDPEGLPVEGVVVYANAGEFSTATAYGYVPPAATEAQGRFTLNGVPAGLELRVYAETKDHALAVAGVYPAPADTNEVTSMELVLLPTETALALIEGEEGHSVSSQAVSVHPVVDGATVWRAERIGRTDESGLLEIDGIVPGLSYFLRDARFESVVGPMPEGWREWFQGKTMVLIPQEP